MSELGTVVLRHRIIKLFLLTLKCTQTRAPYNKKAGFGYDLGLFYVAPCISAVFAIGRSQQMAGVSEFKTSVLFNPNIHFAKQIIA